MSCSASGPTALVIRRTVQVQSEQQETLQWAPELCGTLATPESLAAVSYVQQSVDRLILIERARRVTALLKQHCVNLATLRDAIEYLAEVV